MEKDRRNKNRMLITGEILKSGIRGVILLLSLSNSLTIYLLTIYLLSFKRDFFFFMTLPHTCRPRKYEDKRAESGLSARVGAAQTVPHVRKPYSS